MLSFYHMNRDGATDLSPNKFLSSICCIFFTCEPILAQKELLI